MQIDRIRVLIGRHQELISRAARMIAAHEAGHNLPADAMYDLNELSELDRLCLDCWSASTGTTPIEAGYVPPLDASYRSEHRKSDDPIAWLRAFKRSLERSRRAFEVLLAGGSGNVHIGDNYSLSNVNEVLGVGPGAAGIKITLSDTIAQIDLEQLIIQLKTLRSQLRAEASTIDEDAALASVGAAEKAAASGDRQSMATHLKAAGAWAFKVATKIGTSVAAKAIETAMHL